MIGFLNPLVLAGLALAGLPPLLHLLGRRQPPIVPFPAVRYLSAAEREHSRKLKLRNLLLMVLRMVIIALIVLAAARPVVPVGGGSSHPPAALAVVVDNSLSSGAVVEGRSVLDVVRDGARAVVSHATGDDRLWLVLAEGVPTRVTPVEALRRLDALTARPTRLDLGEAVRAAAAVVGESGLQQREIVVFSDLQATAVSGGEPVAVPVWVAGPPAAPENAGIDSLVIEPSVWTLSGEVVAAIGGTRDAPVGVRLVMDEMELARSVGHVGERVALEATPPRLGWLAGAVHLDADELRADDHRWFAVRATEPVAVRIVAPLGPFVSEGLAVLIEAGQLRAGPGVTLGDRPTTGPSVVFPPAEPAMIGAVNRTLAAAGVSWRYGEVIEGEWTLATGGVGDGVPVFRRHRLTGSGAVIARVAGEPWLVQDGPVTVVASRFAPDWTAMPASAAFLPFLRHMITEVAVREAGVVSTFVGAAVTVPAAAVALELPAGRVRIPESGIIAPVADPGVYALLDAEADTVGAVVVNHDPRESVLTPATDAQLAAAWGPTTRVLSGRELETSLFGGTARAELSTVLLVAALLVAVAELFVSGFGGGGIRS